MRWSRSLTWTAIKLFLFACACLVVTIALALRVGHIVLFSHRTGYTAVLSDASGLRAGDPVKIAGVTVGQVNSVGVDHGHAVVGFGLDNGGRIRQGTGVGLRWLDVIGDKVLYLYPSQSGPWLQPGGTLGLSNDVADASIGQFLSTLSPFLQSIDPKEANAVLVSLSTALQGNESTVRSLLDNAARVAATLGGDNNAIGAVINEYNQVASALAAHHSDIATLISNLATVAHGLAGRNTLLDAMVGNLSKVSSEFGGLLRGNRSNLDTTIANLAAVTRVLASHQTDLATSLATLPTGLAPYQQVSAYGQWFNINVVYSCIANQTVCTYYNGANQPPGAASPIAGLPSPPSLSGAGAAGAAKTAGSGSPLSGGSLGSLTGAGSGAGPSPLGSLFGPLAGQLGGQ